MRNKKRRSRKRSVKKALVVFFGMALLCGSMGCKKSDNPSGNQADGTKTPEQNDTVIEQDAPRGGATYMITDKGWYFLDKEKGLRYYDFASGTELPLCNKPECRHDGNAFCAATNARYHFDRVCLYGGRIYLTAVEETDTQFLYKLLYVTLDGSELSEVTTYYTLEKTEGLVGIPKENGVFERDKSLFIHQNTVFLPLEITVENAGGDLYGTAVYNMDTKKLSFLDEEPLSRDNFRVKKNIQGSGNAIFYCRQEKRNYFLYRYDIRDGSITTCDMLTGFNGNYHVADEDTIVYVRPVKARVVYYHCSTRETEEKKSVTYSNQGWQMKEENVKAPVPGDEIDGGAAKYIIEKVEEIEGWDDRYLITDSVPVEINKLYSDGTYFYVFHVFSNFRGEYDAEQNDVIVRREHRLEVFDKNFERIAVADLYPDLERERKKVEYFYLEEAYLAFLGEYIYLPAEIKVTENGEKQGRYFRIKRSDVLAGGQVSLEEIYTGRLLPYEASNE